MGEASATNGGSAFARQILYCVLGSGDAFIIEDHSKSLSVNFGQLDEGMSYENVMADRKLEIWRVRIDFEDFREMEAPKEVRATFDIGFILLHELLHGLGLKDTSQEEEVGECEEAVNQARADLGLPVRDQYLGETLKISQYHVSLRLRFRSSMKEEQGKARYLFFLLPPGYTSLKCMR